MGGRRGAGTLAEWADAGARAPLAEWADAGARAPLAEWGGGWVR
ncbi:hypothetical protein [Actinotalea lenta]|nr:hypothetical protein [Isoptericola sp. b490]